MIKKEICALLLVNLLFASVSKKIIKSNDHYLEIELNLNVKTEADLFPISLLIGLPNSKIPKTTVEFNNEIKAPFKTLQKKNV